MTKSQQAVHSSLMSNVQILYCLHTLWHLCHCALPHIHDMWFRGWALVVGTIWQCSVCRLHSLGNESESISKTPARALAAQLRGKCLSQLTSTQQALPGRTLGWQWTEPDLPSLGTGQSLGQGPSRPYASRLQEGRRDTA